MIGFLFLSMRSATILRRVVTMSVARVRIMFHQGMPTHRADLNGDARRAAPGTVMSSGRSNFRGIGSWWAGPAATAECELVRLRVAPIAGEFVPGQSQLDQSLPVGAFGCRGALHRRLGLVLWIVRGTHEANSSRQIWTSRWQFRPYDSGVFSCHSNRRIPSQFRLNRSLADRRGKHGPHDCFRTSPARQGEAGFHSDPSVNCVTACPQRLG